ncbi:uncharacterized protein LOC135489046 [Lineus longissimus]|uniref:uncharacterized protein LOC135489046 n=1 Tax=Lineus longissimus TaxID=88925 RepID=UPI002B4D932D
MGSTSSKPPPNYHPKKSGSFCLTDKALERRRLKRLHSISDLPAPKNAKYVTQEELFWTGKRSLVPSLEKLQHVDDHVLKTPTHLSRNADVLVKHLISVGRTKLEQFRAIFRWTAENIAYDVVYLNTGRPQQNEPEDVLRNGYAVCAGYVNLIQSFCRIANITCRYIGGMSKSGEYMPGDEIDMEEDKGHAWLIVNLGGRDYLCDPTWAAGSTEGDNRRKVFKKCWEETWFLSNPDQFLESHWPRADSPTGTREEKRTDLQLVSNSVQNFDEWLKRPLKKGGGPYDVTVDLLTHSTGVQELLDNTAEIKIQYNKCPLAVHAKLFVARSETELKGYAKVEQRGNTYITYVRLPKANIKYLLKINGGPLYPALDSDRASNLVTYKLIGKGPQTNQSYPGEKDSYNVGVGRKFTDSGYNAGSIPHPFIRTATGKLQLKFGIPHNASSRDVTAKLTFGAQGESLKKEFCLDMINQNTLTCHLNLKRKGEYLFSILTRIPERNKPDQFSFAANFVINCENPTTDPVNFPERQFPYGPTREFYALGFKIIRPHDSLLVARDGTTEMVIQRPDDVFFTYVLMKNGTRYPTEHKCIMADVKGDVVHFKFRLPEKGMFQFYITELEDGQATEWLCFCLIDSKAPYQGELFPEHWTCWGPTLEFRKLGFRTKNRKSSTVVAKNGKCCLTIANPLRRDRIMYKVLNQNGKEINENACCDVTTNGQVLSFHFRFAEAGLYTFRLSSISARHEWDDWLAFYLIDCRAPWQGVLFPRLETPIGGTIAMVELGMRPAKDRYFVKTKTGRCAIKFNADNALHVVHSLTRNNTKLNQHVYAETQPRVLNSKGLAIIYNLALPESGMYLLTGWQTEGGSTKSQLFRIVIECKQPATPCVPFFSNQNTPNFSVGLDETAIEKSGVRPQNLKSSTLSPDRRGTVEVILDNPKNSDSVWGWLVSANTAAPSTELMRYILKQKTSGKVTLKVTPPEPGWYLLHIGTKVHGQTVQPCSFLIDVKQSQPEGGGFPTAFGSFVECNGALLHSPLLHALTRDQDYIFKLTVPGADAVRAGDTVLQKGRGDTFTGKMRIDAASKDVVIVGEFRSKATALLKFDLLGKAPKKKKLQA